MDIKTIFVNICHGNEPYILGMNIAKGLSSYVESNKGYKPKIILPSLYGERQKRISLEEGLIDDNVILDDKLGSMYLPILFRDGDFSKNLSDLFKNQNAVERAVRTYLNDNFGDISIELNLGAQISGTGAVSYLAYPSIYSELYKNTLKVPELMEYMPPKGDLERLIAMMQKVEDSVGTFFIPDYHAFSYNQNRQPSKKEISTPPLKPIPRKNTDVIPANSVYVMLSGTGTDAENLLKEARKAKNAGYNVIVPFWTPTDEFEKRGVNIISNDNLKRVISRCGWGTIWTCQNSWKEFVTIPYTLGDEPEVYFNVKTVEAIPVLKATENQFKKFGNLDGINYVVNHIIKDIK